MAIVDVSKTKNMRGSIIIFILEYQKGWAISMVKLLNIENLVFTALE